MRRMAETIVIAGALLSAASASAERLEAFKIANWSAGAYSYAGSNRFSHCAAAARYRNGITMLFSINRAYEWSMGFANPNWTLTRGNAYDIAFRVDYTSTITARAVAVSDRQVEVHLADSATLFSRFKYGNQLRVASAGKVFSFNLTDTSAILPQLLRCVKLYVDAPQRNANSNSSADFFGPPAKEKSRDLFGPESKSEPERIARATDGAGDAASRIEAATLAANLLAQSGIRDFHIMTPNEMGALKVHAAWRAGAVLGTVQVLSATNLKLDEIPGKLIGGDAQTCKGKFFSGSLPDQQGGSPTARVFTTCETNGETLTIYYLGVSRPSGGYYVLATSAKGSEVPAKEADESLRSAVFKVLAK
jgi:hypothetical protein